MVNKNFLIMSFFALFLILFYFMVAPQYQTYEKNTILLGASLPLSGINSHLGKDIVVGANTYFSHTNARGGIQGKKIEFIQYDDKYEPENTFSNTIKLITKDEVFALFGFVGTPTVKRVLPLIIESNIPFIAPYTGASFLRTKDTDNIVNFRSSYTNELDALVEYLTKQKNITRFAIFYQNDDYGEEGYIALTNALSKRNLSLIAEGTYKRNTLSIRHAIHEIEAAKPEAIILVGAYKPTARFIEKVKEYGSSKIIFCPISFVNADALMGELQGKGDNILFSQTVPSYDDFYSKEAVEYLRNLAFYYPEEKPSLVSYEAYLSAKTTVAALRSINGTITRSKFLDKLKHVSPRTLDNIPLLYHNAQLLNQVYLSNYVNGKFEIIQKYEY
ncbi:ABC transporter substrate-binding protein [Sulfurospirillum diekertiae]|uniref:ABC transporter substrate-binding protein n=1 Tax=Sulfurospirillum diekertiae TaxID=1854492 RepID=A0A6G9VRH1_9BACT|nr:ABC transporter substrate-binding protein [Sulfurospirillum diekertiae]QIR75755.1 ABC transporter substrate-binding protein [Sulfurospirillum diekertiae]QIR78401.1 ABC transporter substrate-binding protein [Sulfurospirillum diekertiae]